MYINLFYRESRTALRKIAHLSAGVLYAGLIARSSVYLRRIVMARAGVGLNADLRKVVSAGFRPILLGLGVWVSVAVSSLVI